MSSQRKKRISRTTITTATAIPAFAPVLRPSLPDDLLLLPVVHEYELWKTLSSPDSLLSKLEQLKVPELWITVGPQTVSRFEREILRLVRSVRNTRRIYQNEPI